MVNDKDNQEPMWREWFIYIPDEGDWPIDYYGHSKKEARIVYLKWSGRTRLPRGSKLWNRPVN